MLHNNSTIFYWRVRLYERESCGEGSCAEAAVTGIGATVHSAAIHFGISKSTVHKDIPKIAGTFYNKSTIFSLGGVPV